MKEDKILKKIHKTQALLRRKRKELSWDQETKLIERIAKKVARKYGYRVFPSAKRPYALSADEQ